MNDNELPQWPESNLRVEIPEPYLASFFACLGIGLLQAIKDNAIPARAGIWSLGPPWAARLKGKVPDPIVEVFDQTDELDAVEAALGVHQRDETIAELIAQLEDVLRQIRDPIWGIYRVSPEGTISEWPTGMDEITDEEWQSIGGVIGDPPESEASPDVLPLEEFRRRVTVIEGEEADLLRARYIERFVDRSSEYYRGNIEEEAAAGEDGCYTGYLWDTLKHREVTSEDQVFDDLAHWNQVYVFWDLHNARKIRVPDYWKFPLRAVLRLSGPDLVHGFQHLPEDIYIFDDEMQSSLILTHEDFRGSWCLKAT